APPRCYSGPRGARHEKPRTRCVSHAPRRAAPRAHQRSLPHRRRHGGEPRAVPRPDRSRLVGRQPQPPPPHPRPRAQAHLEDRRGARAHRRRLVRQVRGVRGGHRHRAAEGAPGDHALHRLQVAPGSAGAQAPHLVSVPRKAVIPAAGLGTRFLPATKAIPKEMLPIVDVPGPCTRQLLQVFATHGPVIALLAVPPEKTHLYGVIAGKQIAQGLYHVDTLVEKPAPGTAPTNLSVLGRYVLPPEIFDILEH